MVTDRELARMKAEAVETLAYIDGGISADEQRWRWVKTSSDDDLERLCEQINENFDAFVDHEIEVLRELAK